MEITKTIFNPNIELQEEKNPIVVAFERKAQEWLQIHLEIQAGKYSNVQALYNTPWGWQILSQCLSMDPEELGEIDGLIDVYKQIQFTLLDTYEGSVSDKFKILYNNIILDINRSLEAECEKHYIAFGKDILLVTNEKILHEAYSLIEMAPFLSVEGGAQGLIGHIILGGCRYISQLDLNTEKGCDLFGRYLEINLHYLTTFIKNITTDEALRTFRHFAESIEKSAGDITINPSMLCLLNFTAIVHDDIIAEDDVWTVNDSDRKLGMLETFQHTLELCKTLKDKQLARDVFHCAMQMLDCGISHQILLDHQHRRRNIQRALDTMKKLQGSEFSDLNITHFREAIIHNVIVPISFGLFDLIIDDVPVSDRCEYILGNYFLTYFPQRYSMSTDQMVEMPQVDLTEQVSNFLKLSSSSEYKKLVDEILSLITLYQLCVTPELEKLIDHYKDHISLLFDLGLRVLSGSKKAGFPCSTYKPCMGLIHVMRNYPDVVQDPEWSTILRDSLLEIYIHKDNSLESLSPEEASALLDVLILVGVPEADISSYDVLVSSKRKGLKFSRQNGFNRSEGLGQFKTYCDLVRKLERIIGKGTKGTDTLVDYVKEKTKGTGKSSYKKPCNPRIEEQQKLLEFVKKRNAEISSQELKNRKTKDFLEIEMKKIPSQKQIFRLSDLEPQLRKETVSFTELQQELHALQISKERKTGLKVLKDRPVDVKENIQIIEKEIELPKYQASTTIFNTLNRIFHKDKVKVRFDEVKQLFKDLGIEDKGQVGSHLHFDFTSLKTSEFEWALIDNKCVAQKWTRKGEVTVALMTIPYKKLTGIVGPHMLLELAEKFTLLGIIPNHTVFDAHTLTKK